jgi:DNA-directed RNA polymerase specialized sigma24 family protein
MSSQASRTKWRALIGSLPTLKRYVRRLTGDDERADEILQEVSLRMLATEGPDEPERYAAWGRGVVRHVIAHDSRMRRRARAEQPFEEELVEEFVDRPIDPEAHIDARAWVERIVGDLDNEGLELLYRRYVLQESGKELADDHASSPAAMRMRLMRLRTSVSALARSALDALPFAATLSAAALDFPLA